MSEEAQLVDELRWWLICQDLKSRPMEWGRVATGLPRDPIPHMQHLLSSNTELEVEVQVVRTISGLWDIYARHLGP